MSDSTPLRRIALGELKHELSSTRRILERIPEDRTGWKPHAKSMSLGGLGWHIANILMWQRYVLQSDEYDFAAAPPPRTDDPSREEILRHFDEHAGAFQAALDAADDESLGRTWRLRNGDHVIAEATRVRMIRGFGINHLVHHRGQLSVYLRLLDVPVPSLYGPTADER